MERFLFVFVDGLGLGDPDAPHNPLRHPRLELLANFLPRGWRPPVEGGRPDALPVVRRRAPLPFGGEVRATDASLGLPGLPQSATGQTALFTGENAARVLGRHLYGFPTKTLQAMLMRGSVLKRVAEAGGRAAFINAFRPLFFDLGDAVWEKRLSATTWANHAARLPFRTLDDIVAGRAVYQDITDESLRGKGFEVPFVLPEAAGEVMARLSETLDFTLFEFFQTDRAGHAQDEGKAVYELVKLERFLRAALTRLDLDRCTMVVTSDHGNLEDLSIRTHTPHPVPTLVFGRRAAAIAERLDRLEVFTPVILEEMGIGPVARV
jgi:2,3-bisphosphoglycerate-independent phosphoglycerate mutase